MHKKQPILSRDQGMYIPAITLKLLSYDPRHNEWLNHANSPTDGSRVLAENLGTEIQLSNESVIASYEEIGLLSFKAYTFI